MTLREALDALLEPARTEPPSAEALRERFAPLAKRITEAGPQLARPAWAKRVSGAGDIFLELEGDLAGLQLWEDGRGWGAYAELALNRGTLADVEAVVGPTQAMPRAPGALGSGDKRAVYIHVGGRTVRVFVELSGRGPDVARVTAHFQR